MNPRPTEPKGQNLALDEGFITTSDGVRLYRRALVPREPSQARGHIAIVHGYGEHSGRYREVMQRLAREGLAAHAFDLRGHGQSQGRRAHVDAFAQYLLDLDAHFEHVQARASGAPVFALGHSLGGLILATWLIDRCPEVVGAVLASPFVGLALEVPRLKELAARALDHVAPGFALGNGLRYEQLTHDLEIIAATRADPLYQRITTPRWFFETQRAQASTCQRAGELKLSCLVLVGEADPIASPAATRRFFGALGSQDKALANYDGFLHELFNETGRDRVFADVHAWLERHLPPAPSS